MQNRKRGEEEDVSMDDETDEDAFVCKECVSLRRLTIFCSERCATENMARHREREHEAKTEADDIPGLVTLLSDVVETVLRRENPGVRMELM